MQVGGESDGQVRLVRDNRNRLVTVLGSLSGQEVEDLRVISITISVVFGVNAPLLVLSGSK